MGMVSLKNYQNDILKSFLILVPLLALYVTIGLYREDAEDEVDTARQTIAKLQGQIEKLNLEVTFLKENRKKYEALVDQGWLRPIHRIHAAHVIEDISNQTDLNEVSYDLVALASDQRPLGTTGNLVRLEFTGVLDSHVYDFIENLDQKLPGQIIPDSLRLTRYDAINHESLQALSSLSRPNYVSGEYLFRWLVNDTPQP